MHPTLGVEIQLLGPVGIRTGDGRVLSPSRTAAVSLLAVLAVEAGTPVSETALLDRVWREDSPREPRRERCGATSTGCVTPLTEAGGSRDWVTWDPRSRSWTLAVNPRVVDYHRLPR